MLTEKQKQTISTLIEGAISNSIVWYLNFENDIYHCQIGEFKVSIKTDFCYKLNVFSQDGHKRYLHITTSDCIVLSQIFFSEAFYVRTYLHTDEVAAAAKIWVEDCELMTLLFKAVEENEKKNRVYLQSPDISLDKLATIVKNKINNLK